MARNLGELQLLLEAERDENTCREDYLPEEAVHLGGRIEKLFKPEAEKAAEEGRTKGATEGGRTAGRGRPIASRKTLPKGNSQDESKRTTAQASAAVGMSRPTYEKAKVVVQSGDRKLIDEMNRTGKVNGGSQRAMLAQELQGSFAAEAKARQLEGNARGGRGGKSVETLPPTSTAKSRDQAGAIAGVSGRLVADAAVVVKQGEPEVVESVKAGGVPYVNLRRLCECLGLAVERQTTKLRDAHWATLTMMVAVGADGKDREMVFVSADTIPVWLATQYPTTAAPSTAVAGNHSGQYAVGKIGKPAGPVVSPRRHTHPAGRLVF